MMIETALSAIGLFVVIKFCVRNRRCLMNRENFFVSVNALRKGITECWDHIHQHRNLDDIVDNVTGDDDMQTTKETLTDRAIALIKEIKQIKENEAMTTQAEEIIEKIKEALNA